jgi:hypothetical protein
LLFYIGRLLLFFHAGEEVGVLAGEEQLSILMAGEVDLLFATVQTGTSRGIPS